MAFIRQPARPHRLPARPSRLRLFFVIMLVYGFVKYAGISHLQLHLPRLNLPGPDGLTAARIVPESGIADAGLPGFRGWHLGGDRVWGTGAALALGDSRTHLPGSLLSRFSPAPLILPSCLTATPLAVPTTQKRLPVRDDWPGFYGAPWIASMDGNLVALLDVAAPRNTALVPLAPKFQFYPNYHGQPDPDFSLAASARLYRGSKAVLYRVFLNGPAEPFRCLDLVVQNGENNGVGHLYYQKYHHYYETDIRFIVQQ